MATRSASTVSGQSGQRRPTPVFGLGNSHHPVSRLTADSGSAAQSPLPKPALTPSRIIARSAGSGSSRTRTGSPPSPSPSTSTSRPASASRSNRSSAASIIFAGGFARCRRSTDREGGENSGPYRAGRSKSPDSNPNLKMLLIRVTPFGTRCGPHPAPATPLVHHPDPQRREASRCEVRDRPTRPEHGDHHVRHQLVLGEHAGGQFTRLNLPGLCGQELVAEVRHSEPVGR